MWVDDDLKKQLQSNYTITSKARILAEINLNAVVAPEAIGVYQYEQTWLPLNIYAPGLEKTIFVAEDLAEIPTQLIEKGTPLLEQYFSLKECFTFRRPRAGIVYPLYFDQITPLYIENYRTAARPRNYIAGKNMAFKYWTSMKMDGLDPLNLSSATYSTSFNGYPISNACPTIVFKEIAYTNKIVVKIQTHAGTGESDDPITAKWVPSNWQVEYLTDQDQWIPAYKFPDNYEIPVDGNIELMYGPTSPLGYEDVFKLYGKIEFKNEVNKIPAEYLHTGMSYVLNDSSIYLYDGTGWVEQSLVYGWIDGTDDPFQYTVDEIVDPDPKQFLAIKGVRLFVRAMALPEIPFDLIELSPRLQLDITKYVDTYDIDKSLGLSTDLPISDLSNDVGSLTLINYNLAFSKLNLYDPETGKGSLISKYMNDHTKILLYTAIKSDPILWKYIPIKTMYVEYWPIADPGTGDLIVSMRDYFIFMESLPAPDLFYTDVAMTYVMATLFDNVGITNYAFIGFNQFNDINFPYFFCNESQSVLDVLSDLVHSARCGVYFDEYNNLIVASKDYLSGVDRTKNIDLNGKNTDTELTDIESITIGKRVTYNDGEILYSPKFIQKQPINLEMAFRVGKDQKYLYEPVKLWQLGEKDSENEYTSVNKNIGSFALTSVLLNENLSDEVPTYDEATNTYRHFTIDVGITAWYINRFSGYFYANGEIIRYDGVQYRISGGKNAGDVWIRSVQEYNNYIRNIPWNGWIDVTGKVRVWTEVENGKLTRHGRGYFKTPVMNHTTGGDEYWTKSVNFEALEMEHKVLFNPCDAVSFTDYNIAVNPNDRWVGSGKPGTRAPAPTFQLTSSFTNDQKLNNIKASALNWKGPAQSESLNNRTINYFRRPFEPGVNYQRFGCRMRIVGEPVSTDNGISQQPDGRLKLFGSDAAAGGLALFTDDKRQGYFLEVVAFSNDMDSLKIDCPEGYGSETHNLVFYKVMSVRLEDGSIVSMPFKLWAADIPLALDSGKFILEDAAHNSVNNVVDLEVECYRNEFDIYYNGKKLGTAVDDVNSMILQNAKYFDEATNDQFNGDDNKNIIRSVPQLNRDSKFWGPFIRGDSRVLFEHLWAAENKTPTNETETDTPEIFGEIELDNNFGTTQIDSIYRRHSLSGFVNKGMLTNFVNDGNKYNIYYEEFGTILRECFLVDARYTEAFPTLYARILPTVDMANPFAISQEQLGPYGTEFVIFNVADKMIILDEGSEVIIKGIAISQEAKAQITVDQFVRKSQKDEVRPGLTSAILESRRRNGKKAFAAIESGLYIQSSAIAEQILDWALRYFTAEKLQCNATIFANPMIQLADIVEFHGLAGKTIKDGTVMIVESIGYSHDSTGPKMTVGLRQVL